MDNGIGKVYELDRITREDKMTGVQVTRLTDNQGNTRHPYFTQPLISKDSRYLLVTSDRTGSYQLFIMDLDKPQMVQLTAETNKKTVRWWGMKESRGGSPCLDGKRMIAYYWSGNILKSINISNMKTDELYRVPEGFTPNILSMTADGQYIDFCYSEVVKLSSKDWKEQLYRRPTSVIMRVNVQNKRAEAIWGEREFISHVNTSPVDPNIVLFCHEGPWHLVQRMWIVRADSGEYWPLVKQKMCLERAGHEFFTAGGRIVTQYGVRDTPFSEWKNADLFISPDGTNREEYYYPGPKPGHIQVNSQETLGVGDRIHLEPDHSDGINYIGLIKYEDGRANLKLLCRHDTDWSKAHPHPIFTRDEKHVIFDSNFEGYTNIYRAPVVLT